MNAPTLPLSRRLSRDECLSFAGAPALRLAAERGTLWVTLDGIGEDFEIGAGQARIFDGRRTITVGTLRGEAEVRATPLELPRAARPRWWQRWLAMGASA